MLNVSDLCILKELANARKVSSRDTALNISAEDLIRGRKGITNIVLEIPAGIDVIGAVREAFTFSNLQSLTVFYEEASAEEMLNLKKRVISFLDSNSKSQKLEEFILRRKLEGEETPFSPTVLKVTRVKGKVFVDKREG